MSGCIQFLIAVAVVCAIIGFAKGLLGIDK